VAVVSAFARFRKANLELTHMYRNVGVVSAKRKISDHDVDSSWICFYLQLGLYIQLITPAFWRVFLSMILMVTSI